jgi:HlyD family secretion protein
MIVETSLVRRGPLAATVTAEGRSRVKNLYVVTAPVSGDLERVVVEPGDSVSPRTTIARMWPLAPSPLDVRSRAMAVAVVAAARAAVARTEANEKEAAGALAHAESLLATARTLVPGGAAPTKELEHADHEAEIRRRAVEAAHAAVEAARAELVRAEAAAGPGGRQPMRPATHIESPIGGRVLRVRRDTAGPVAAGTPLVEIGNISALDIVADLLTADAMRVQTGAAATVTDWGGPRPIAARVRRVEPAAFTKISALGLEEQRVRVVLDLAEPPPPGLGHDFHVNVSIVVWNGENVLTIPSTALFRSGDQWAVFSLRDGRARLTPVTPGPSDSSSTAVAAGLSEAAEVVVQPSDVLRDGARAEPARRTARAAQ